MRKIVYDKDEIKKVIADDIERVATTVTVDEVKIIVVSGGMEMPVDDVRIEVRI